MEKKTAHYSLKEVKALIEAGHVKSTNSALKGASELGLCFEDMLEVVQSLEPGDLHKSMTSQYNKKIWQDVYHYQAEIADLYVKIQVIDGVVIISFKEL